VGRRQKTAFDAVFGVVPTPRYMMNWSATAVAGGGVKIKSLSQDQALARQDEISNWDDLLSTGKT
jgi:hypothetical protein